MDDWKEFFERMRKYPTGTLLATGSIEDMYQAFKDRMIEEQMLDAAGPGTYLKREGDDLIWVDVPTVKEGL